MALADWIPWRRTVAEELLGGFDAVTRGGILSALTWADVGEGPAPSSSVRVGTPSQAMSASSAAYAAVRFKSRQLAAFPWQLHEIHRTTRTRRGEDHGHWIARLMAHPNPLLSRYSLWETIIYHLELSGVGYALKRFAMGNRREREGEVRVRELWPVPSSGVTPKIVGGELFYEISGSNLEVVNPVPASAMLRIPGLYSDAMTAVSPITYARRAYETAGALSIRTHKLWAEKGAGIVGVLQQTGSAKWEHALDFHERFEKLWAGPNSHGSTAISPKGYEFKWDQLKLADAQFLETVKASAETVWVHIHGLPLGLLDENRSKYASAKQAADNLVRFHLRPEMERVEGAVTLSLMGAELRNRYELALDASHLLRGDVTEQADRLRGLVKDGLISPNEARVELGKPRDETNPDMDVARVRANSAPEPAEAEPKPEPEPEEGDEDANDLAARVVSLLEQEHRSAA